jgi:biopolymer transport protein ExbD
MIVRLVDMVLLTLFGFICVSHLEDQVKVTLPVSAQIPVEANERTEAFSITIDILGNYYVAGATSPSTPDEVFADLDAQNAAWGYKGTVRVLIRADRAAPISQVKALVRACTERNMAASLVIVKQQPQ